MHLYVVDYDKIYILRLLGILPRIIETADLHVRFLTSGLGFEVSLVR